MIQPPLRPADLQRGKSLVSKKLYKGLSFSRGTYQLEMKEGGKSFFPFLQLTDTGEWRDGLCSCKEHETHGSCAHLAAAYLFLRDDKAPLHVRFRESFWNRLCEMAALRIGFDPQFSKKEGVFQELSQTGKLLFSFEPLTEEMKKETKGFLLERKRETEETSLKFSDLSLEEITLYREGRPTRALLYELSFWADLAKRLFLLQETEAAYKIDFHGEGIPRACQVSFPPFRSLFYIAEAVWPSLIPSLSTVIAPLKVYGMRSQLRIEARYDEERCELLLERPKTHIEVPTYAKEKAVQVGDYDFVPQKGFFLRTQDPLIMQEVVQGREIGTFLDRHADAAKEWLKKTKLHRERAPLRYQLDFANDGTLHIKSYLLKEGDLQEPKAALLGTWAYLPEKGFFAVEQPLFTSAHTIIQADKLSTFISSHRHFLQGQEGFQPHLSFVEVPLQFTLDEQNVLKLSSALSQREEEEARDLGEWVYIRGRGFFPKREEMRLRAGMEIPEQEIPGFLTKYREELERIENLFMPFSPIERCGLDITLTNEGRISLKPNFTWKNGYQSKAIRLFDRFTYVDKEGFCEIPSEFRLPEGYMQPRVIAASEEPYFFATDFEAILPFVLSIDPRLKPARELQLAIRSMKRDAKGKKGGWLLELHYESEIGETSLFEVWCGLQAQRRFLPTTAGLLSLSRMRMSWLASLNKKRWQKGGKVVRLTSLEFLRLLALEKIREPEEEESKKLLELWRSFSTEEKPDLSLLQSSLRPYQEIGVQWLFFLYSAGLSGFLCDEMGLGKTHQAMALLSAVHALSLESGEKKRYLVICPTSVLFHWEDLLKRFLPAIKVLRYWGPQRSLDSDYDLLLTSYGTVRSEGKALTSLGFEIAILDEIQYAKNPYSKTHRALRKLEAEMRIGLTGTPVENRLLELKALFDLILPTYLPPEAAFKELFIAPIEKGKDPEKEKLLAQLISPFILRRRKGEVLLELPEKIEEVVYCPLSPLQRDLYKQIVFRERDEIEKALKEKEQPLSYPHIFALLTKLKQLCDHPALITGDVDSYRREGSGKWELFTQILDEARTSGQKVVVFSQYLGMLDLMGRYLKEEGIAFAEIRGATRDRKEEVERFQKDPNCMVFLGSLQAAGVGIDLTAASIVVHYDRWWNPARENQATDRVHRIGQSRGVQVFKMVVKGTIEEEIHAIIERKLTLMEGVIGFDAVDELKGLDREELLRLLRSLNLSMESETFVSDSQ